MSNARIPGFILVVIACISFAGCVNGPFSDDYTVKDEALSDETIAELRSALIAACVNAGFEKRDESPSEFWYYRAPTSDRKGKSVDYIHILFMLDRNKLWIAIRSECPDCPTVAPFRQTIEEIIKIHLPEAKIAEEHSRLIITFS